ncbi:glycosyltransferase [Candidatus Sumerlaeota bacterium]|nr:glycosyltransferase [Candidatus Sumerlaeota bacterium]
MPELAVVLPAYNEEQTLPPLLEEFVAVLPGLEFNSSILVVNDGSVDGTRAAALKLAERMPYLRVIDNPQNMGLGPTVLRGLRIASETVGEDGVIVCMDADNTHPPDVIPAMLEQLRGGADIVIASRYRKGSRQVGVPLFRRLLSLGGRAVFTIFSRIPGVRDYTCGFRAYSNRVVRRGFEEHGDQLISRAGFACTDELLVKLAPYCRRIGEVPFTLRYDRKHGRSKLPFWATVKATLQLIIKKSH